jgi:flagellar hook-associated protein 1 FlgK
MDRYYRDENTVMSYYQEFVNNGKFVEDTMNELSGTGVTGALNKYYAAAQALANDPTSPTVRNDFIQQASKVATDFNSKTQTLEDYRKMLAGDATNIDSVESSQLSGYVKTVNALLDELANVNTKISTTYNAGAQPNALMDKRDLLLDQLSDLVPVKTEDLPDGQIRFYAGFH